MHGKDMKKHSELMEIVQQLRKASEMHANQADRIEQICRDMMGGTQNMKGDQQTEAIMIAIGTESPMSKAGEEVVMVMEPGMPAARFGGMYGY
tara:strand:+ start:233 stop:511 length:279 start_codon:yes stop_codon:yes gene_type:complete